MKLSVFAPALFLVACSGGGPELGGRPGATDGGTTGGSTSGTGGGIPMDSGSGGSTNGDPGAGGSTDGLSTGGMASDGAGSGGVGNPAGGNGNTGSGGAAGSGGNEGDCSATGFHVKAGKIYDKKCNEFLLRGINYPYAWYATDGASRFSDMAGQGANAVRVVLASGDQWTKTPVSTVAEIISWLKDNQMIGILEVHDFTGSGESAGAVDPTDKAVSYWTSIKSALDGQEAYVMINIANEAFGNFDTAAEDEDRWENFHVGAVAALRDAGFSHTLIVDAPNWGQDWRNIMRDNANDSVTNIFEADPDGNVVFSVHMYDVYGSASTVQSYFSSFLAHGYPLIVGEFAADHGTGKEVDEGTIMAECASRGVGYLGWSWSGNGSGLESLDIAQNFNAQNLTPWGETLSHGDHGIANSAEICSVY